MHRYLVCAVLLSVSLFTTANDSVAGKELTVRRVETVNITPLGPAGASLQADCLLGNTNAPAWAIPDFIMPPERYKFMFDPKATCEACPMGIAVNAVYILMQFAEACDMTVYVDIEEASYLPGEPECPRPGEEWCTSGPFIVEIPEAGMYDIGFPIDCPCLTDERIYAIGLTIEDASCLTGTVPELVTDNTPLPCTSWNNYDEVWDDLVLTYAGWPGNLEFGAEADCCSTPLPVEASTWGHIKSLYVR